MKDQQKKTNSRLKDTFLVFVNEFRILFKDRGVVIIFTLAPLLYPILYGVLYNNETVENVPVAVVDCSRSQRSAELRRHIDATKDVEIASTFNSFGEAKEAYNDQKVHGIIYIPADFNKKLSSGEQTTVSIYCDMSSFMYYRTILMASNYCILDMNKKIQVERLNAQGLTGEMASMISEPIPNTNVALYNEGNGFASFLLPAILILIIYQTLFFGIGMLAGSSREENRFHELVSSSIHRGSTFRVIIGKSACYLILYGVWTYYILGIVPHIFNLPHIGNMVDVMLLMLPFLLATIFFSMTISVFMPNRETVMVVFLFLSLILLFLSGVSWPESNINGFWKVLRLMFPSTHGIQGYIKINTMGATLQQVSYEYISLWAQTALYFLTATWAYHWQIKKSSRKYKKSLEEKIELVNELN